MPSKLDRMRDKELVAYARNAAQSGVAAQRAAVEPVVSAIRKENTLLKTQNLNLKVANSQLAKENGALQKYMTALRGLDIGIVLRRMFGARGPYQKDDYDCYQLPDKREVKTIGSHWHMGTEKRGKGAIDLVMALQGYEQKDLHQALGALGKVFGAEAVAGEYVGKTIERAQFEVEYAIGKIDRKPTNSQEHSRQSGKSR